MPRFRELRKFIADRLNSKEIESELAKIPVYIGSSGNGYRKIAFFPAQIKMEHDLKEHFDPVLIHEYTHAINHQNMAPLTPTQESYLKKAYPMPWINTVYPFDNKEELGYRHIDESRAENNALKYIFYQKYKKDSPNTTFEEYIDALPEEEIIKTMENYPSGYLYHPAYDPANPDYEEEHKK